MDREVALGRLVADRFASRLAAQDPTLWLPDQQPEAAIRMGWVAFEEDADRLITEAAEHRAALRRDGIDTFVLCGMGGSSLAPELFAEWNNVPLTILDSTHPAQVRAVTEMDLERVAVIVASKSGSTLETRSQLETFEQLFSANGYSPQQRIIVITDPGSPLAEYAAEQGYKTFFADPHVGGRFSALTAFGLVPPTLAGAELAPHIEEAAAEAQACLQDSESNPALLLAAQLMSHYPDKFVLTLLPAEPEAKALGEWVEQLVAESTGKQGHGFLPIAIAEENIGPSLSELDAELTVALPEAISGATYTSAGTLGAQFFRWMVTTAALGYLLQVNPFDQPDVESAKVAAREALTAPPAASEQLLTAEAAVRSIAAVSDAADYVVVQAFAPRTDESIGTLDAIQARLREKLQKPVAAQFGPRYLHSTGQFHKGGSGSGLFLQVLINVNSDLALPVSGTSYGSIIRSQVLGDAKALRDSGATVFSAAADNLDEVLNSLG